MPTPHVLLGAEASARLRDGIDLLARLVSLSLGPRTGALAFERDDRRKSAELLTSSATIARRMLAIPGRGATAGAMLLRHAIWRTHERLGDGGATTAALTHALLRAGSRQIAAGANPMLLRRGMQHGLELACAALHAQARPLDTPERLGGLAHAATGDPALSRVLGELFGRLGPEAVIRIEEYAASYIAFTVLEGTAWNASMVSPLFITDQARRATRFRDARLLVTDQVIDRPAQLIRLLEQLVARRAGPLLILAEDVTGPARALLLANRDRGVIQVVAARPGWVGAERRGTYEDVALLTNAYFFAKDRADVLDTADLSELGHARLAEVDAERLTIVGGAGVPAQIELRRQMVRHQLGAAADEEARRREIERLGRLAGGVGVLKLGAASDSERQVRKELAERFIRFVPSAAEEGVVPGGGAAYLGCQAALDAACAGGDEVAAGVGLVRSALEAPMSWLVQNAGMSAPVALAEVRRNGPGWGIDVMHETCVDMWSANVLDAAKVARIALESAVSVAAMALTAGAVVLKRRPVYSRTP
jgi:chaperonin GroEL